MTKRKKWKSGGARTLRYVGISFPLIVVIYFLLPSEPEEYNLFFLKRNLDNDVINYDINFDEKGELDLESPIKFYWKRENENGKIEKLNYVQRKFAYGLNYLNKSKDEVKFKFVSYENKTFYLKKLKGEERFEVITHLPDKSVIVKSIYVHITGGVAQMAPKVAYMKLYWKNCYSDEEGTDIFKP